MISGFYGTYFNDKNTRQLTPEMTPFRPYAEDKDKQ
jgi:hypothetical protein